MKISPISILPFTRLQNTQPVNKQPQMIAFTSGNDTFIHGSILDREINELKEVVQNEINPFIDKNKENYNKIGKIGYASQEKLKLVQSLEQQLFQKKFNALDNNTFKEVEQVTGIYEKYKDNIRQFEQTSKNIATSTMYSTPELLKTIEKSRPKVYQGEDEFNKIQPLYQEYNNTKDIINKDLDNVSIKKTPEFDAKVKELQNQNTTAIFIMLNSGYVDMLKISNDAGQLFKDYEEKNEPAYKLLDRAERLNCEIQKFQNNMGNYHNQDEEIEKFIEENKSYETTSLSKEEIKKVYGFLFKDADMIINFYSDNLYDYFQTNPVKLSPRIIDKTFKAQEKANRNINKLLQKEKQAFYEKSNRDLTGF